MHMNKKVDLPFFYFKYYYMKRTVLTPFVDCTLVEPLGS
jgi:hypothetical protein